MVWKLPQNSKTVKLYLKNLLIIFSGVFRIITLGSNDQPKKPFRETRQSRLAAQIFLKNGLIIKGEISGVFHHARPASLFRGGILMPRRQ